jgi:hypothetical protein
MRDEKKQLFTWYWVRPGDESYGYEMRLSDDDDAYAMAYLYEYPPGCLNAEAFWSESEEFDPLAASTSAADVSDIFAWATEQVAAMSAQKANELRQQIKVIETAVRNLSPGIREGEA